jgi:hypothetical protein
MKPTREDFDKLRRRQELYRAHTTPRSITKLTLRNRVLLPSWLWQVQLYMRLLWKLDMLQRKQRKLRRGSADG